MVAHVVRDRSVSEQAQQAFVDAASKIPGGLVKTFGGPELPNQSILVIVPDMLGATADEVYELEVLIRKQYKHSRLNLEVLPRDIYELETRTD